MNWKVRPMTPGDWAMVAIIYKEGIDSQIATFQNALPTQEAWYSSHLPQCRLILENAQEEICGFACLSKFRTPDAYRGIAEVSIYIGGDWQNQGAGGYLLNKLAEEAKKEGFWSLTSWIFLQNEPSIRLHKTCGFHEIGIYPKAAQKNGEWVDLSIMERRL